MGLPLISFPMFLGFFITLRRMAANVESFQQGGALWFLDLTIPDPTYVLPVLSTTLALLTLEVSMRFGNSPMDSARVPNHLMKYIRWGLRGVFVIMLPMVSHFPAVSVH